MGLRGKGGERKPRAPIEEGEAPEGAQCRRHGFCEFWRPHREEELAQMRPSTPRSAAPSSCPATLPSRLHQSSHVDKLLQLATPEPSTPSPLTPLRLSIFASSASPATMRLYLPRTIRYRRHSSNFTEVEMGVKFFSFILTDCT